MLHMTVADMLERMPSSELTEWHLYLRWKSKEQEKAEMKARMRR